MTFAWWHILVFLVPILPNLWSIWHILGHSFATPEARMHWLLLAIFVPVFGGMVYIFYGRSKARPLAGGGPDSQGGGDAV